MESNIRSVESCLFLSIGVALAIIRQDKVVIEQKEEVKRLRNLTIAKSAAILLKTQKKEIHDFFQMLNNNEEDIVEGKEKEKESM